MVLGVKQQLARQHVKAGVLNPSLVFGITDSIRVMTQARNNLGVRHWKRNNNHRKAGGRIPT
jgi:hypothetical protein